MSKGSGKRGVLRHALVFSPVVAFLAMVAVYLEGWFLPRVLVNAYAVATLLYVLAWLLLLPYLLVTGRYVRRVVSGIALAILALLVGTTVAFLLALGAAM